MLDVQTYLAAKSGKLPASPDMDMFSYLLGKSQASPTKTITGVPPFTFKSNGDNLVDWSIKGNTGGVGERTKNLLEITATSEEMALNGIKFTVDKENGIIIANGQATTLRIFDVGTITNETSKPIDYYLSGGADGGAESTYFLIGTNVNVRLKKWNGTSDMNGSISLTNDQQMQIPAGVTGTMRIYIRKGTVCENLVFKPMVRLPHTSADFIPYGYEIPVTCGGTTTDIFIGDSPLGADDTITRTITGVDIPTVNGSNTLTVDTYVQPSEMTITYHK